jgi:hypothetical protein
MTTTDSNGIVFLEDTDPISPFHTLMNVLQQGTSDAIAALKYEGMRVALGGSGQNIANGSTTVLSVGTPSASRVSPGWTRNSTQVISGHDGVAMINVTVDAVSGGAFSGRHFLEILVNGVAHRTTLYGEQNGTATILYPIASGDTISAQLYQASGATREYTGWMTVVALGKPTGWT